MHPITALMLSRQQEEERRRVLSLRHHRYAEIEISAAAQKRVPWLDRIRLPRLSLSGS
jgi:hypothetical protein